MLICTRCRPHKQMTMNSMHPKSLRDRRLWWLSHRISTKMAISMMIILRNLTIFKIALTRNQFQSTTRKIPLSKSRFKICPISMCSAKIKYLTKNELWKISWTTKYQRLKDLFPEFYICMENYYQTAAKKSILNFFICLPEYYNITYLLHLC